MSASVQVSSKHSVALNEDYRHMMEKAPREDFVVRTLARRKAGNTTLMMGELVIAGAQTRENFERAALFPLHFRKTYYPGKLHGDPQLEFDRHKLASELIGVPAPIGSTPNSFRSCFLPGVPLDRLSTLGAEPQESNILIAQKLSLPEASGLWQLTERVYKLIDLLHAEGICHGDVHLHNLIVCPSPLEVLPIDFELAIVRESQSEEEWGRACRADQQYLLQFAVYLQCCLGHQQGTMADDSIARIDQLVQNKEPFLKAIGERSFDHEFG
jgi:hypothetical protein